MFIQTILGVVALAAAAAAAAADTPTSAPALTRAQVRQATLAARAAGELHVGDEVRYPATPRTPPGKPLHWKKRAQPAADPKATKP